MSGHCFAAFAAAAFAAGFAARYRFGDPIQGWVPSHLFRRDEEPLVRGYEFGWTVAFAVNAKNSYGGYTGEERYEALFQDGRLRAVLRPGRARDASGFPTWQVVQRSTRRRSTALIWWIAMGSAA